MAQRKKRRKSKGSSGSNRKTGAEFLDQNSRKEGIHETDSGLQYQVIDEQEGQSPGLEERVKIHQRALLLDGKVLEDTYRQNKPDEVRLKEMIEGLQEGLQLMHAGSRYKFWIPPELGWGKKGSGNKIPPQAVIVFDIRLLEIID